MRLVLLIILLSTVLCAAPADAAFFGLFGDGIENVTARDGQLVLDLSALPNKVSRHYRYQEGNQAVKFFVVRDEQGTIRAAIDACDVCWKSGKGYALKDGAMLCVNCGMRFAMSRIGTVSGGCNPHPFSFTLDGNALVVATDELLREGTKFFPEGR